MLYCRSQLSYYLFSGHLTKGDKGVHCNRVLWDAGVRQEGIWVSPLYECDPEE